MHDFQMGNESVCNIVVCMCGKQDRSNCYGLSRTGFWPGHKLFSYQFDKLTVHVKCVRQII